MTQIKRLVFFGCSITFGTGLTEGQKIWTQNVCENLNFEHHNMGLSGASNDDIRAHIEWYLEKKLPDASSRYKSGDCVVIALTGLTRNNIYYDINDSVESKLDKTILAIKQISDMLSERNIPFVFVEAFINYKKYIELDHTYTKNFLLWEDSETSLYDMLLDTFGSTIDAGDFKLDHDHLHDTSNPELCLPCKHPTEYGHSIISTRLTPIISEHLAALSDK